MKNLLRPNQIEELESERGRLEASLTSEDSRVDKAMMRKQMARVDRMISDQAPKKPPDNERAKLEKREKDLLEKITQGMPDEATMRKNPPGAVDQHMAWEKKNKADIMEWKNLRLQLNAGEDNQDVANLERYRPKGNQGGLMADAQIPGHLSMQNVPRERYDLAFGDKDAKAAAMEVLAANEGVSVDEIKSRLEKPQRRELSEEEKQKRRDNLAKARAAKQAKHEG